jgi:hypothetical protein
VGVSYATFQVTSALLLAAIATSEEPPVALVLVVAAGFAAIVEVLLDAFGVFGGEPSIPRELQHSAHTIQPLLLGDARGKLVWSQAQTGQVPGDAPLLEKPTNPELKRAPQLSPESIFQACIHQTLLTGGGSGLLVGCYVGGAICVGTLGEPAACVPTIFACMGVLNIQHQCRKLSEHPKSGQEIQP